MILINFVLFALGSFVFLSVIDRPSRFDLELLFLIVPAFLSVASTLYLGFCLVRPQRLPSEYIAIPLPNDNYEKVRRRVHAMGYVNLVYAISLLMMFGFMAFETFKYYNRRHSDDFGKLVLTLMTLGVLVFALGHIWHVIRYRKLLA